MFYFFLIDTDVKSKLVLLGVPETKLNYILAEVEGSNFIELAQRFEKGNNL